MNLLWYFRINPILVYIFIQIDEWTTSLQRTWSEEHIKIRKNHIIQKFKRARAQPQLTIHCFIWKSELHRSTKGLKMSNKNNGNWFNSLLHWTIWRATSPKISVEWTNEWNRSWIFISFIFMSFFSVVVPFFLFWVWVRRCARAYPCKACDVVFHLGRKWTVWHVMCFWSVFVKLWTDTFKVDYQTLMLCKKWFRSCDVDSNDTQCFWRCCWLRRPNCIAYAPDVVKQQQ